MMPYLPHTSVCVPTTSEELTSQHALSTIMQSTVMYGTLKKLLAQKSWRRNDE